MFCRYALQFKLIGDRPQFMNEISKTKDTSIKRSKYAKKGAQVSRRSPFIITPYKLEMPLNFDFIK